MDSNIRESTSEILQKPIKCSRWKDERQKVCSLFEEFAAGLETLKGIGNVYEDVDKAYEGINDSIERALKRLKSEVKVAFTGETSSGKSTLINSLLGQRLFATHTLACTYAITLLRKGTVLKIKVEGKTELGPKELSEEAAAEWAYKRLKELSPTRGDTDSFDDAPKQVEVFWPFPCAFLEDDMVLVDTPGVGESKEVDKILLDFVPSATATVYVINSANAGGVRKNKLVQLMALRDRWQNKNPVAPTSPDCTVFVCNKWDDVDDKEDVRLHTKKVLCQYGFQSCQVLHCCAKKPVKFMEDFNQLIQTVKHLIDCAFKERCLLGLSWLKTACAQVKAPLQLFINRSGQTKQQWDERKQAAMHILTQLEMKVENDKRWLETLIKDHEERICCQLLEHLQTEDARKKMVNILGDEVLRKAQTSEVFQKRTEDIFRCKLYTEVVIFEAKTRNFENMEKDVRTSFYKFLRDLCGMLDCLQKSFVKDMNVQTVTPNPYTTIILDDETASDSSDSSEDSNASMMASGEGIGSSLLRVVAISTMPIWIPVLVLFLEFHELMNMDVSRRYSIFAKDMHAKLNREIVPTIVKGKVQDTAIARRINYFYEHTFPHMLECITVQLEREGDTSQLDIGIKEVREKFEIFENLGLNVSHLIRHLSGIPGNNNGTLTGLSSLQSGQDSIAAYYSNCSTEKY